MKVRNYAVTVALISTLSLAVEAGASGVFLGQSGQYHVIPQGQDVQKITLIGKKGEFCGSNQLTIFPVDEFGHVDTAPFVVPSETVFLLTDADFDGYVGSGSYNGYTPKLFIYQFNGQQAQQQTRAVFRASGALNASNSEFSGGGSLASGVAFPTNTKLCAQVGYLGAPTAGTGTGLVLQDVTLQGTVVDNTRTNSYPYFTW